MLRMLILAALLVVVMAPSAQAGYYYTPPYRPYLQGIADRQGYFVIRHHANLTLAPVGDWGAETETETGWVSERTAWVQRDDQNVIQVRCIRVRLKQRKRRAVGIVAVRNPTTRATVAGTLFIFLAHDG